MDIATYTIYDADSRLAPSNIGHRHTHRKSVLLLTRVSDVVLRACEVEAGSFSGVASQNRGEKCYHHKTAPEGLELEGPSPSRRAVVGSRDVHPRGPCRGIYWGNPAELENSLSAIPEDTVMLEELSTESTLYDPSASNNARRHLPDR